MGEQIAERNRLTTDRLRALVERAPADRLRAEIDRPWTAAALLAHIAFWDRFVRQRWELAARSGAELPSSVDDDAVDAINDAALPQWLLVPPEDAGRECVSAAEEIDAFVAALSPNVVRALVDAGRPRLADRSLHRDAHLAALERAFPW